MKNLLQGFDKYKSNVYANLKGHMQGLAEGQEPHTFLITCSDSRISTDQFVQASPGEIFVIRNAGNTIKPYDSEDPDSLAVTLEYGVVALNIPEIVVCGHVSCGAMDGILNLDKLDSLPLVQKGLRGVKEDFEFDLEKVEGLDQLVELNVRQQLKNLMSYPFIKERVEQGKLTLWGWVYDFAAGELVSKFSLEKDL